MKSKPCQATGTDGKPCKSTDFTVMTHKTPGRGRGGGKLSYIEKCWRCGAVRPLAD